MPLGAAQRMTSNELPVLGPVGEDEVPGRNLWAGAEACQQSWEARHGQGTVGRSGGPRVLAYTPGSEPTVWLGGPGRGAGFSLDAGLGNSGQGGQGTGVDALPVPGPLLPVALLTSSEDLSIVFGCFCFYFIFIIT